MANAWTYFKTSVNTSHCYYHCHVINAHIAFRLKGRNVCVCAHVTSGSKTIPVKYLKSSVFHSAFKQPLNCWHEIFHTYQSLCFGLQTFLLHHPLLRRWCAVLWTVVIVILTHPPQLWECDADAVKNDGCDGKTNSWQIQNHIEDDLKWKTQLAFMKPNTKPNLPLLSYNKLIPSRKYCILFVLKWNNIKYINI